MHQQKLAVIGSCLLAFVFLLPRPAVAQAVGAIVGTVTDPSGAVLPGARVTAMNEATHVSQSTITGSAGTYTLPQLPVGTYTVTADAKGFQKGNTSGITLDVSQKREVNFAVTVLGISETVKVDTTPPLLNTTDATVAGLVSEEQVQSLPLNGRSIAGLVFMQPGVVADTGGMGWMTGQGAGGQNNGQQSGQWIANGNRGETMVGTLDNADVSDAEMGTIQFENFNLDAVSEFKVLQNDYSAEYGQGGGTITQVVSKSGTNQFHGSAFEYLRNSAFDARNYFSTSTPGFPAVPPFKRNEFGATFGGPIRKEKTFFFIEYAGLRQRLGEPAVVQVPTADERTGIVPYNYYDPNTQTNTVHTFQVPVNSVASQIVNSYPLPNLSSGGPNAGPNAFYYEFSQPTNDDQWSARVDQHFAKDSLFVRASYQNNITKDTDSWAAEIAGGNFSASNVGEARNYVLSDTHVFSPTLLNTFTFTLNRGIEGVPEVPGEETTTNTGFGDGTLQGFGPDTFYTKYVVTVFDYKDDVSWTKGRHSFKLGGQFRREWDNGTGVTSTGQSGAYNFASNTPLAQAITSNDGSNITLPVGYVAPSAAQSPTPSLFAMLEGDTAFPSHYTRATAVPGYGPAGGGNNWWYLRRWTSALYAQDNITVNRRFTLNLGLRYEYASVPWELKNRFARPADSGPLFGDFIVNPQPLWTPDKLKGDFAPRLGMALNLGGKTVVRGGFALFTNMIPTVYPDQALVNFPIASLNTISGGPYTLTAQPVSLPFLTNLAGTTTYTNSKTVPANTAVQIAPYAAILGPLNGDYPSSTLTNGYTISGNITIEHQFPGGIAGQAAYILNNGVDLYNSNYPNALSGALPQFAPFDAITPGIGELEMITNNAHSTYNGLQLQARKISPTHGLMFQANYTWAKNLTDADAVWSSGGSNGGIVPNNPQCVSCERGLSSYSIGQRFVGNFEYNLPFAHFSSVPRRLTQGWKAMGIFSAQSGNPFTVVDFQTTEYGFDVVEGISGARPDLLQKATYARKQLPGGAYQFFSDAVIGLTAGVPISQQSNIPWGQGTGFFGIPPALPAPNNSLVFPGDLGRNTFVGPAWWNFDASLIKDTQITERTGLQFRAEFFNIMNHTTFATPNGGLGSTNFGLSTSTATTERQIQLGLRVTY
jgi:Carboxypeptidase regulatory-like domain